MQVSTPGRKVSPVMYVSNGTTELGKKQNKGNPQGIKKTPNLIIMRCCWNIFL